MNKHKDHDASCICCEFFHLSLGTFDYSEDTPGELAHLICRKGHFYLDTGDDVDQNIMHKALNCPDYKEAE